MSMRRGGDTLGLITGILSPLTGRRILDIGCGGGHLLRALSGHGARLAGVDPDAAALEEARRLAPRAFVRQASAEKLPFADGVFEASIFLNSLHHVPVPAMSVALAEAARVVGKGGSVIVVEPLAEGNFFETLRPIEDETSVRLAAQQILARIVEAGVMLELQRVDYDRVESFSSVQAFIDRAVGVDPVRKEKALQEREKVMKRFDTLAVRDPKGYSLTQPMRLQHLQAPG